MKRIKLLLIAGLLASCQSGKKADTALKSRSPKTVYYTEPFIKRGNDLTIAFVGDVIIHQRIRVREEKTHEGFQSIWAPVQNYLDRAHITYANLEGPVAPEYGGPTGFPMFNFPEEIIPALKNSGFDIVSTANNHALDRQAKGIRKTIENLKKYELGFAGTITDQSQITQGFETWWTLMPIPNSNRSIAWIACTEMTNGNPDKEDLVLYCFKHREKIKALITQLKENLEIGAIIITPHWGEEDKFEIEPHVKAWGRTMLELGATAIVGSHPHVVQPIEQITTKDNRKTVIAYSMGNFVSNQITIQNKTSMILYLKFKNGADQKWLELVDVKYLPLFTTRTIVKDDTSVFRINPVWQGDKVPAEVKQILKTTLGEERQLKSKQEVEDFLK